MDILFSCKSLRTDLHLYNWVYNSNGENIYPDPSELLNVEQWVNAYRSGDYVSRYLLHKPGSTGFNNRWEQVKLKGELSEPNKVCQEHAKPEDWFYYQSKVFCSDIEGDREEDNSEKKEDRKEVEKAKRREFCIGADGHIH